MGTKAIILFCRQILTLWLIFYIVPKEISKLIIKLSPASKVRKFLSSCNVLNGILISGLLMLKPFVKMQLELYTTNYFCYCLAYDFGVIHTITPTRKRPGLKILVFFLVFTLLNF